MIELEQLQQLIQENDLGDKVELAGTFCMGKSISSSKRLI